jgi:TRAP-type C4-dicarboxylate transport system substrate-binding protein
MKKAILLLAVFGMGCLMGIPEKKCEAAPKIMINAVSCWPISHVNNDYYKEFIKRVNDKAKEELEIKLLGGPEVVAVFDQLKAAATGLVDMIHGDPNYFAGIIPEAGLLTMARPKFLLQAIRESGVIDVYNQACLERGKVLFLGGSNIGMPFYIMTNKPVSKLEDLRGLKLRSIGGLGDVLLGEFGASVVKIASAETYEGLQRGIVDGALRNTLSLVEFKEYEVMRYIIFPPIVSPFGALWVGEKKWNMIPKNLQTMIKEVAIETEAEAYKYYDNMDKARLKEVQEKHGMKLVNLSDKDAVKFSEIRAGAAIKDWVYSKGPKFGPLIYEKMLPYIK